MGCELVESKNVGEQDRSETVAAIWGYPADNGPALATALPPAVVRCFGLNDLANELASTEKGAINPSNAATVGRKIEPVSGKTVKPNPVPQESVEPVDPLEARVYKMEASVSDWILKDVLLDQDTAKYIRNSLAMIYDQHANADWYGAKSKPDIRSGNFVNINVPNAHGNRLKQVVNFVSEAEYKKRSVWITEVSLALARFGLYMDKKMVRTGLIRKLRKIIWLYSPLLTVGFPTLSPNSCAASVKIRGWH